MLAILKWNLRWTFNRFCVSVPPVPRWWEWQLAVCIRNLFRFQVKQFVIVWWEELKFSCSGSVSDCAPSGKVTTQKHPGPGEVSFAWQAGVWADRWDGRKNGTRGDYLFSPLHTTHSAEMFHCCSSCGLLSATLPHDSPIRQQTTTCWQKLDEDISFTSYNSK